jgi:asparagine synthase (glutamine-hydrolysing)
MSSIEAAVGLPLGDDGRRPDPIGAEGVPPLTALEDAVVPALARPPCLVSFSGGRDSSAVLAAAARAARREGLPAPVPITLRFPHAPETEESAWQEDVVRHLRVEDWIRVELTRELDFVGRYARGPLLRHGPLYPANVCVVVPMLERGRGGSLLVGLGGDELFALWRWRRLADALARRRAPGPRDLLRLGFALAPARLRHPLLARRAALASLPWLRPQARAAVRALQASRQAHEPVRWPRFVAKLATRRDVALALGFLTTIGADLDVEVRAPLVDERFLGAVGRAGGSTGFGDRSAAMRCVFQDALPSPVLTRSDKAVFTGAFWTDEAREFAERWSGDGLDGSVVDPDAVRQTWLAEPPDYRSAMLLQIAWLHDHRAAAQPGGRVPGGENGERS